MKRHTILVIALLIFSIGLPTTYAQQTSTQGKEFWLSFMHNGFRNHSQGGWITTQVLISAKRDCAGTIANPLTGWEQTFIARSNSITTIDIPEEQGYHNQVNYEEISNKALKITANDTISVYCTNIAHVSFDASFVLPTESLGDEYIIQTYDQSSIGSDDAWEGETSAILIIATEDNTEIEITPSVNTLGNHPANTPFSITMNAGETYQIRSSNYGNTRDLSGTHILASDCKRIAVFNGNNITTVPSSITNGFDIVFEQAMPLRSWGKNFVVTSSLTRNRDFIKITSSANDNQVTKNGVLLTTLRAGESYVFDMLESDHSCFLQATQPSAVYLYHTSSRDQNPAGGNGDPSMVWIAPVEQRINDVTFSTFDHPNINIETHSVNIIVNTEDIGQVYFDNELISPLLFSRVNGNQDYSFTRMDITHGVHHITCANGFNAHVYGFGYAKGYAYLVGSNAIDLSTAITINDLSVQSNDNFQYCVEEPVVFKAEVNLQNYNLLWDFGDGSTSILNPVTHVYHERRIFPATLTVTTEAGGCTGSDSDTTRIFIDVTQQYVTESDEVCAGGLYNGYGFNNVHITNDTILARLVDNPVNPECKDSLLVYITTRPNYHIPINDSRCWQGQPGVYDSHGFSFVYDHPGTYDQQLYLSTVDGCDSVLNLHLIVDDQITHEFDHHECGSSYVWDGQSYSESGDYERLYTTLGGCDSIVTLHLTMGQPQYTSFDTITCSTFYWNGQEYSSSGTYQQQFLTYDGCDSIVECHLTLSGNVEGTTLEVSECDSYNWLGTDYTVSGQYDKTLSTQLGCDSIVHLNLDLQYTPDPTEIYPTDPNNTTPHWVVTATEFQINDYEFHFWDNNDHCQWDSVTWSFENPEVRWVIEPDSTTHPVGKKCRIFVLNHVDDTVWLSAKVYNQCHLQGKEQRYWFLCSFYGVDEFGSGAFDFDIVPNPNNGAMTLNFNQMTGNLDVRVYDMRGVLIDQFKANGPTMSYYSKTQTQGLYFFVVTGKEGTVSKKVIIHP